MDTLARMQQRRAMGLLFAVLAAALTAVAVFAFCGRRQRSAPRDRRRSGRRRGVAGDALAERVPAAEALRLRNRPENAVFSWA